MDYKYVGKDIVRPDAIGKVTGKAIFFDDIRIPNTLFAEIIRPDCAHAKIISIDTSEAEKSEGVVKVITGKGCKLKFGVPIRDEPPMAVDTVRYIGEPVAAVVADSLYHAKKAAKKIKVKYKPLPVYIDALNAMGKNAFLIHKENGKYWHLPDTNPQEKTNIATHYVLNKGNIEKGFKEADIIVEGEFNYPFGSSSAIEPHGSIVWFHEDGIIEVWSSSICPFIIREDLANAYGIPISDVRVHIPEVGGCFGYKGDLNIEKTIAYIASFVPGHPIKWYASRKEDFTSTFMGHGIRTKMKIGAKKDGKFVAIKTTVYHSTGAYASGGVYVAMGSAHNSTGPYEFPNCYLESYSVYTNTPPIGAFRGYGHQESQLATERLIDILARKLDMSPFRLRGKNYLKEGKVNALGEKMWKTNGDIKKCADIIEQKIFLKEKSKENNEFYYGRGFAAMMKAPKGAPFSSKGCYLKFNIDGSVSINMGGIEVGQGLRTVVRQITAEALKISPEKVRVYTEVDTQFSPWEWQTIGSMFTIQGGRAIIRAAQKAINKLKDIASQVLRCDSDLLEYDGEYVFLKADPSVRVSIKKIVRGYMYEDGVTIGEIVQTTSDARLPMYSTYDPKTGQGAMGVSYTYGAQACELRINKNTGEIIIDHFSSSFDVGKVINPIQIRGQVVGAVVMGIGGALYEELKFDNKGKLINPYFSKYHLPTIKDAPKKQTVEFVETPGEIGPFGARGIGEVPIVGVAPAILNAIYDAIGVDFYEIPITRERIKKVLAEKRRHRRYAKGGGK